MLDLWTVNPARKDLLPRGEPRKHAQTDAVAIVVAIGVALGSAGSLLTREPIGALMLGVGVTVAVVFGYALVGVYLATMAEDEVKTVDSNSPSFRSGVIFYSQSQEGIRVAEHSIPELRELLHVTAASAQKKSPPG